MRERIPPPWNLGLDHTSSLILSLWAALALVPAFVAEAVDLSDSIAISVALLSSDFGAKSLSKIVALRDALLPLWWRPIGRPNAFATLWRYKCFIRDINASLFWTRPWIHAELVRFCVNVSMIVWSEDDLELSQLTLESCRPCSISSPSWLFAC